MRFYANRFQVTNDGPQAATYVLERRWPGDRPLPAVTFNQREWARERQGDRLTVTLSLDPGQSADLAIVRECPADDAGVSWKPSSRYKAGVLVRRVLSEFRDAHVDTHPALRKVVTNVRKRLKRPRAGSDQRTLSGRLAEADSAGEPCR
jgi:hypothetical protein